MMVLRVVIAIVFLGVTTWFQVREHAYSQLNFWPLYGVVVALGLLTIFYALYISKVRNLRLFAYGQVSADIALITLTVCVTGGAESYLPTLFFLSIIGSSIVLSRSGGLYAASFASIAYGVLIDVDFYGWLPDRFKVIIPSATQTWEEVLATAATNILAFFTVAYLTGYLAERMAKVEKELEEKEIDFERLEELNRHIVENITSGIMTLDEDLRITSFNGAAEAVTGWTLREVYHKEVEEIFPGMIVGSEEPIHGRPREEKLFCRKDGVEIFLGYNISTGKGGDASNIVIFQDLTQLKVMEEQLRRDERLKALGELSVGIAHEIRNPLASISGSIQVLKDDLRIEGEDKRLMEIVLRETERLNELITDFLLFAKPAREQRHLVNLTAIVRETLEMFTNSSEAQDIKIECDLMDEIYIMGNERQMGQVFWNLFLNASHAMSVGGRLKITSRPVSGDLSSSGDRHFVELRVADNGEGISAEDINRIFDPFFSTKDAGTGLGLALVHRIVASHEGSIKVASVQGEGTVFRVVLPLAGQSAYALTGI